MITERDEYRKNERPALALSLVASLLINLLTWALIIWGAGVQLHIARRDQPREYLVASSSIRIERRTVPQPPRPVAQPHPAQQAVPQPAQAARQAKAAPPQPQARPTEIARDVPHAPPQPRAGKSAHEPSSLQAQLAQQEQAFAREAQALSGARAPLSIASSAPFSPSSIHRSYMDLSGRDQREHVEAVLEPLPGRHWYANGMSCYYVHYDAQYGGGGTEEGNIPWPVCYPAQHDAMLPLDRVHTLPIPAPPSGYVLPPGATLGPLLEEIYRGEIHNEAQ